jgi:hypothetical protein
MRGDLHLVMVLAGLCAGCAYAEGGDAKSLIGCNQRQQRLDMEVVPDDQHFNQDYSVTE